MSFHEGHTAQDLADIAAGESRSKASTLVCLEVAAALGPGVILGEWLRACDLLGLECDAAMVDALVDAELAYRDDDVWGFADPSSIDVLGKSAFEGGRWQRQRAACAQAIFEYHSVESPQTAERRAAHLIEAEQHEDALAPLLVAEQYHYDQGDYPRAEALLDEFEGILNVLEAAGDDARRGQSRWRRARILHARGVSEEALEQAEEGERLLEGSDLAAERGQAVLLVGRMLRDMGDRDRALEKLSEAIAHFGSAGDDRGLAMTRASLGMLHLSRGDARSAVGLFEKAQLSFEAIGESHLVGSVLIYAAQAWHNLGDRLKATECIEGAREVAERDGDLKHQAAAWNFEGEIARENEDWGYAIRCYKTAAGLYSDIGDSNQHIARFNIALANIGKGDFEPADAILDELEDIYTEIGFGGRLGLIFAARILVASLQHDFDAVDLYLDKLQRFVAESDVAHHDILEQLDRARERLLDKEQEALAERVDSVATEQREALTN